MTHVAESVDADYNMKHRLKTVSLNKVHLF